MQNCKFTTPILSRSADSPVGILTILFYSNDTRWDSVMTGNQDVLGLIIEPETLQTHLDDDNFIDR